MHPSVNMTKVIEKTKNSIGGGKAMFIAFIVIDVALLALVTMITGTTDTRSYKQVMPSQKEDPLYLNHVKNKKINKQMSITSKTKNTLNGLHRIKINRTIPSCIGWCETSRSRLDDAFMHANESCLRGMFNHVLLVIVYHYPFYESIPTLTKFYNLAFKKVVICGPSKSESYPVITVDLKKGHYAYECLGKAVRENPGYGGYMYINDDMIVNWWNLGHFDTNRVWAGTVIGIGAEVGKPPPDHWGAWSPGLTTCSQTIKQLEHLAHTGKIHWMKSSYNMYINNSRGKQLCRSALSDFFYVPKRAAEKFQILSNMFFSNKVFLEIAVPTMLTFLDSERHFEHVYGFYLPNKYGYIDFSDGRLFWSEYNYKPLYFMHPFKLHGNANRLSEFLFKTYVYDYGEKVSQCSNR